MISLHRRRFLFGLGLALTLAVVAVGFTPITPEAWAAWRATWVIGAGLGIAAGIALMAFPSV